MFPWHWNMTSNTSCFKASTPVWIWATVWILTLPYDRWCTRALKKQCSNGWSGRFSCLLNSWITYPAQEKYRSQLQNPWPTRTVQASDPTHTRVSHSTLFFTCFIEIVRVTRRVLEPVQDSGRDNPHYNSLLVVEVLETSENPTQSLIHNIIWRHTQYLAVILCIILYYIDTYLNIILFTYRAPGVRKRQQSILLHAAVHAGLQGVNADWL